MVLAQFHIHADEFFETVTHQSPSSPVLLMPNPSQWWQGRLGFPSSPFSPPVLRHTERHEGAIQTLSEPEGAIPDVISFKGDDNDVSEGDYEGDKWHSVASSEAESDDASNDDPNDPPDIGTPPTQAPSVRPHEGASAREQGTEGPEPRRSNWTGSALQGASSKNRHSSFTQSRPGRSVLRCRRIPNSRIKLIQSVLRQLPIQTQCTIYTKHSAILPDWSNFQMTMLEEVQAHKLSGHWELVVDRKDILEGMPVFPSVWSMKRKPCINTPRKIYKWKARFTVHGGKQPGKQN